MGALKIPQSRDKLVTLVEGLLDECYVSLERRREQYRYYRSFFNTGSADGSGSKHNKCYSHIDTLSSLLFSASDLRFDVTFDGAEVGESAEMGEAVARVLTKEYYRNRMGLIFGQGVDEALVTGCCFVKKVWSFDGPRSFLIRPQFMGVLREDLGSLDDQDAFVHSFYVTPKGLYRLLAGHSDRDEIMQKVTDQASKPSQTDISDDYFHEMVRGGLQPIGLGAATNQRGTVNPYANPAPLLAPDVAATLIRIDDLWIMDDEREDWTTIRYVKPGIVLEGTMRHRNLSDIPKEQPFIKVCPNEIPGYMWGMSELATVTGLQTLITARINDMDNIIRRQANPSRAFIGFSTITPERAAALLSLNGYMTDDAPNGKIQDLATQMPPNMMEFLAYLDQCFDEQAGITKMMSGQGEPGVRSGTHAGTLLRTSTPRLRDRAMLVENQCATDGDMTLHMLQAKNATVFKTAKGEEFILKQVPPDATVTVDSHSSSPAFSGDIATIAFALRRTGAIDDADLLKMLPGLPRASELELKAKQRAAEQAQLIAQHPELLAKGGHGGGKR